MDKKELIRKSAINVIAVEGYHNTTIKMIAKEADIAVGTIYNYFKNKDEIIDYIFKVEHDKRIKFLNGILETDSSLQSKIKAFLDYHFTDLEKNKYVGKVLIQESILPNKRSVDGIQKFLTDLPKIFAEMLKKAREKGEIKDMNFELISNAIFHAIRGVVYNIESTQQKEKDYAQVKEDLLNFILNGIYK